MKNQGAWVFIKFTLIHENRKKYHRFFFVVVVANYRFFFLVIDDQILAHDGIMHSIITS